MKFGFHISISGGFSKVVGRAKERQCQVIQLFSRSPRGWQYPPLDSTQVETFKKELAKSGILPPVIHMPYLPNLASPDQELYLKSVQSLATELARAQELGAQWVVIHVGNRLESSEKQAVSKVAQGINEAHKNVNNSVRVLLENTAGQGSEVGYSFESIKQIIDRVEDRTRIGVCLDTAHAFEAGYDLSASSGLEKSLGEFEDLIGFENLHLLHLNDSKTPFNSRKDRHWHIGQGYIGQEGFFNIVNHPKLSHLPGIMVTPKIDQLGSDLTNMAAIKSLVAGSIPSS